MGRRTYSQRSRNAAISFACRSRSSEALAQLPAECGERHRFQSPPVLRLSAPPRCQTKSGGRMILVPAMSLEDWKKLVPDPDEQWKPGSPANALAASWHGLMRFPREISALFSAADATRGATLLLA